MMDEWKWWRVFDQSWRKGGIGRSCQFESNPDLAHHPFRRRILACNVTRSLRGQLFRNWTGERGQTSFQTNGPATLFVLFTFSNLIQLFSNDLYIYIFSISWIYDETLIFKINKYIYFLPLKIFPESLSAR